MGRKLIDLDDWLDELTCELAHAIDTGEDENTVNALIDEIAAVEDRQKRQDRYLARKHAEAARADELVQQGMSPDEAQAEATGKTLEQVRKANFIAYARSQGYSGSGFDALITAMHRDLAFNAHAQAMLDCIGYMDRNNRLDNGYRFWFASDTTVRANATDELLEWFAQHGRITRTALRESILSGQPPRTHQIGR